jgi:hypothetical protein
MPKKQPARFMDVEDRELFNTPGAKGLSKSKKTSNRDRLATSAACEVKVVLVSSDEDLLYIMPTTCIKCLENKKDLQVLKDFGLVPITKVPKDTQVIRVRCECPAKI